MSNGDRCSAACGWCGRCSSESEPDPLLRPANRLLDDAVKSQHQWDSEQSDRLLDYLMTMPRKVEARRYLGRLFQRVRKDAVSFPELVDEMDLRQQLAAQDEPAAARRA